MIVTMVVVNVMQSAINQEICVIAVGNYFSLSCVSFRSLTVEWLANDRICSRHLQAMFCNMLALDVMYVTFVKKVKMVFMPDLNMSTPCPMLVIVMVVVIGFLIFHA